MRFLDTNAGRTGILEFIHIADSELRADENKYAILSHRWGSEGEEVLFADIFESKAISSKYGYRKLVEFCVKAYELGCKYGWADTCCINKTDSVELTEAINSMFRWYTNSYVCIVQLKDVPEKPVVEDEWFNRGWTLQELIAPRHAYFYDSRWKFLGTKSGMLTGGGRDNSESNSTRSEIILLDELCRATRVPEDVLSHARDPFTYSIAQRLSWAANRKTTREEDRAYSLLGILDVRIPSIYGEGDRAFRRLQQAIAQQYKDESMFAWGMGIASDERTVAGLLAPSPDSYINCTNVVSVRGSKGFSEANGEMTINLKTYPYSMETYCAVLNCTQEGLEDSVRIAILVARLENDGEYVRVKQDLVNGSKLVSLSDVKYYTDRSLCVSISPNRSDTPLNRFYGFWLRTLEPPGHAGHDIEIWSARRQAQRDCVGLDRGDAGTIGCVFMRGKTEATHSGTTVSDGLSKIRWIQLAFDQDFNPMLFLWRGQRRVPYMEARVPEFRSDEELFEQTIRSPPDPKAMDTTLRGHWITDRYINKYSSVPSRPHGWATGSSVLRVDRHHGVSGILDALNLGIQIKLCSVHSPHTRAQDAIEGAPDHIWVVDLTDTGGSDPDKELVDYEEGIRATERLESCEETCCNVRPDGKADKLRSDRNVARGQRRALVASDLQEFS